MTHQKLLIAATIVVSGVILACSDTSAPNQLADERLALGVPREDAAALHLTKECSPYMDAWPEPPLQDHEIEPRRSPVGTREFARRGR